MSKSNGYPLARKREADNRMNQKCLPKGCLPKGVTKLCSIKGAARVPASPTMMNNLSVIPV